MINMVFSALDPTIREKVISAYLTGHGRNQIARELNEQGFKVSTASVTNFIKGYERQHQETLPNVATTNTAVDMNKGGSPGPVNVEEPIDFLDIPYPDPYPNPNIDHVAIIHQNVPQQDDTTEEEGLEQSQVKPPLRMPQDQSKSKSDLGPEEEPLLIPDWNPDDSYETVFWRRIMAEKKQRQEEYQIIQRERQMLEGERRQLAQQKDLQTGIPRLAY